MVGNATSAPLFAIEKNFGVLVASESAFGVDKAMPCMILGSILPDENIDGMSDLELELCVNGRSVAKSLMPCWQQAGPSRQFHAFHEVVELKAGDKVGLKGLECRTPNNGHLAFVML